MGYEEKIFPKKIYYKSLFNSIVLFGFFKNAYAYSAPQVDVSVNGILVDFTDEVFLKNSLTYVPLREFCEEIGLFVEWDNNKRIASVSFENSFLECYPDKSIAFLNGKENKNIIFKNNKIYISLRNVAGLLSGEVKWYHDIYTAEINSDKELNVNNKKSYTKDDVFWLTKIINAESAGEPIMGKIAVGNVILNRVKSSEFPNNVYSVVFDRKYGVQFEPIINGSIYNDHTLDCIFAAKRALSGENYAGESLYFLNPKTASNLWIVNNRTFMVSINNHDFYL